MKDNKSKSFVSVVACGAEFISAIMVGILIGVWIDKHFDKFPLFSLLFFVLGCVAGYFNVLKYINRTKE